MSRKREEMSKRAEQSKFDEIKTTFHRMRLTSSQMCNEFRFLTLVPNVINYIIFNENLSVNILFTQNRDKKINNTFA